MRPLRAVGLAVDQIIRPHESEGPRLASGRQSARTYAHLFRIPAASYARPVCRWKDLGPPLKTCQRGSLGDHGPVSGDGLTSQWQDLVFSCLAPLHRRGMRLMEEGGRGKTP